LSFRYISSWQLPLSSEYNIFIIYFINFINAWLEKFETWSRHREQVEGTIEERTRIEATIQNTKPEISLILSTSVSTRRDRHVESQAGRHRKGRADVRRDGTLPLCGTGLGAQSTPFTW
jgi:hypothetical protein